MNLLPELTSAKFNHGKEMQLTNIREKKTYTYEYQYDVISPVGRQSITETIYIKFVNGVFDSCDFDFRGKYSREEWKILAAIESEIARIEEDLKNENRA